MRRAANWACCWVWPHTKAKSIPIFSTPMHLILQQVCITKDVSTVSGRSDLVLPMAVSAAAMQDRMKDLISIAIFHSAVMYGMQVHFSNSTFSLFKLLQNIRPKWRLTL